MKNIINKQHYKIIACLALMLLTICCSSTALANDKATPTPSAQDQAIDKALIAGLKAATEGPADIKLLDEATLRIPKSFIFIPRKQAADLLTASGNSPSPTFVGLIMPEDSAFHWFVPVDFVKSGYINVDQHESLDGQDLLELLNASTQVTNKERAMDGFPTIKITGWQQQPVYQSKQHELIWALQGQDSDAYRFVNYNTEILGRDGYFEFTLLAQDQNLKSSKQEAEKIISSLKFKEGKDYDDFVSGTDPVATYGLEALVVGEEAAAKSGWSSLLPWLLALITLAAITVLAYVNVR